MSSSFTCPNGHPVETLDTVCPHCGTLTETEPLPAPAAPLLPTVPGYEILEVLGKGGMGVVYKARQVSLKRTVALKMIRDVGLAGPEERARFRTEAEAVARLVHPNVVQVYEVGEHNGHPFFSLEFVDGGSLAERLRGGLQASEAAARLVEVLARAVQAAHQRGIVHRDLKPANVLLLADGTPKITDFGLAKRLDGATAQTLTGQVLGTPSYMAPEQAEGRSRHIGPTTDVHALAAILYEMLTGRPPFLGATTLDTLAQVRSQEPVPPSRLQPKVPRDLETICLKCLQKEPHRRYASAQELADDLGRFLRHEPIRARPAGAAERLARWCRRHPAVAVLTALLILVFVSGFAGVAWKWREAEQHKQQAQQAEQEAAARAEAEADARRKAEQAQKDTARALKYLTTSSVAAIFGDLSSGRTPLVGRIAKRPEVIRPLQKACAVGEQILENNPSAPLLLSLFEQYAQLSVFEAATGRNAEALRCGRRSLELLDRVDWADRQALGDQKDLGALCFVVGALLMNLKQPAEAVPAFQQAIRHQRPGTASCGWC
jgi:serine/threonine-protein kinase